MVAMGVMVDSGAAEFNSSGITGGRQGGYAVFTLPDVMPYRGEPSIIVTCIEGRLER
jgi:hypothetical protein